MYQCDIERPNGYYNHQIIIFTEGEGQIEVNGKVYAVKPYTAVYIPKNLRHKYYRTGETFTSWWIDFNGCNLERLFNAFGYNGFSVFTIQEPKRLMSIMKKIYYCLCDDKLYGSYYASVELYGFLIDFYKCTKKYPNVKNGLIRASRMLFLLLKRNMQRKSLWKPYAKYRDYRRVFMQIV